MHVMKYSSISVICALSAVLISQDAQAYGDFSAVTKGVCASSNARQLLEDARDGDVDAMRQLGKHLIEGSAMKRDVKNGVLWLKKAVEEGDDRSMVLLGDLYKSGTGVKKSSKKALELYMAAEEAGNKNATKRIKKMSLKEALPWWEARAEEGDKVAILKLLEAYSIGKYGLKQDLGKALELHEDAVSEFPSETEKLIATLPDDIKSKFNGEAAIIQNGEARSDKTDELDKAPLQGTGGLADFEIDFSKPECPLGSPNWKGMGLKSTFYYFKKLENDPPFLTSDDKFKIIEEMKSIIMGDWSNKSFSKLGKSKKTMYSLNFLMPQSKRGEGIPSLYGFGDEAQTNRKLKAWMLVYRGKVVAPKTGTFRFVGAGSSFLGVRFNGELVLEAGRIIPSLYSSKQPKRCILAGRDSDKNNLQYFLKKKKGYEIIKGLYSFGNIDRVFGGLIAGKEFKVEKGKAYPIEVMLSSIDEHENVMMLLIDDTTAGKTQKENYQLFTTSPYLPVRELREKCGYYGLDATSPYDEKSLVWYVEGQEKSADGTPLPIVTIKKELEKEWQKGVPKATVELRFAAEKNLYEKYQKLINDGADVNYEFSDGRYILMNEMGIISEGIDILLDNGADINLVWEEYCDFQATHRVRAMHDANLYFDGIDEKKLNYADDFMCYLHQKGVRFKPSKSGNLPIHYAVLNGWPKYAKLAATSSNITYRNADGTTPIDIVTQCLDEMLKTKKELSSTLIQYIGAPPIYNERRERKLRQIIEIFKQVR